MLQTTNHTPPEKKKKKIYIYIYIYAFEIDIFPIEIKTITNKFD